MEGLYPCMHVLTGCLHSFYSMVDAEAHEKKCSFRHEPCPLECGDKIRRKHMCDHMKITCPHRPVTCQFCNAYFMYKELTNHENVCSYKPIICDYCDHETIKKLLAPHLEKCPMKPNPCIYKALGCGFVGNEIERSEHEEDTDLHFTFLCNKIMTLNKEMEEISQTLKELELSPNVNIKKLVGESMEGIKLYANLIASLG